MSFKKYFPLFANNPWLIYFDNAATTQKPDYVIDGVSEYMKNDYANIHRWFYSLSEKSEILYEKSKEIVAKYIWWNKDELIYTYNSTYWVNIFANSIARSGLLKAWDKVLLTIVEHHANIVPWLILKEDIWIEVEFVIVKNFDIDREDFQKKYDDKVKVIAATYVSNVTWTIFDLEKLWKLKRDDTLFLVDASQAIPNFQVDVKKLNCQAMVFTGHKVMAYTWIWVLWIKDSILKKIKPSLWWWWTVKQVRKDSFDFLDNSQAFEAWTPNLVWAVSLLKAFEFIEKIWWYEKIWEKEQELTKYALSKFLELWDSITLIWKKTYENRVWVFSFVLKNNVSSIRLWEYMSIDNICIRCGWHCAHPLHEELWFKWTCRLSLYIYNDKEEIDRFFEVLKKYL